MNEERTFTKWLHTHTRGGALRDRQATATTVTATATRSRRRRLLPLAACPTKKLGDVAQQHLLRWLAMTADGLMAAVVNHQSITELGY